MREEEYLSPNVKLSGMNGMAQIESEELANDLGNLRRRGQPVTATSGNRSPEPQVLGYHDSYMRYAVYRLYRDQRIFAYLCDHRFCKAQKT